MARLSARIQFPWLLLAALPALLVGCAKPPEITRYQVPHENGAEQQEAATTEAAATEDATASDRMLAALVPHGQQAWSFKLAGPAEAVGKCAESFDALVKSVTFAGSDAKPEWKLPESWTQVPGGAPLRLATISIPAEPKPLELSVVSTSWSVEDENARALANVNRWRGQMQLAPIAEADLAKETRGLELAKGNAIVVDLQGKLKADGMQPPFAGMTGKTELPAGHPSASAPAKRDTNQASESKPIERPSGKATPKKTDAANAPVQDFKLPFAFTAPKGWQPAPLPTFAEAAYGVGEGTDRVDISITPMKGPGGDLLMNINRWRTQQLKLSSIDADQLDSNAAAYKIGGKPGHLVRLYGPETADPRPAISAAIVEADGATWIFKMRGVASAVDAQQDNFQKLIDSIKFK